MKIISLNTWGGRAYQPLIAFVKKHSQDTDIFCFQEIYNTKSSITNYHNIRTNLLTELKKILPNFQIFYSTEIQGFDSCPDPVSFNLSAGKTIFVKTNIKIDKKNKLLIYGSLKENFLKKDFSNLPVTIQSIDFTFNKKRYTVINIHGTAFPGTKLDTKLRLEHSKKIKDFLKSKKGGKIVTGDFNLLPETQSIKILETDMQNLIKEFKIQRTRSKLSPFYGRSDFQKFADYTFVSKDINVENFEVPRVEISDHLPMILEFS